MTAVFPDASPDQGRQGLFLDNAPTGDGGPSFEHCSLPVLKPVRDDVETFFWNRGNKVP